MRKEDFEWIHSWCDLAKNNDLPRVLLIGDSITWGYQEKVRNCLKGFCYVDFLSTSYSIDNPFYSKLIKNFVTNSSYDLVHFNFGLHGKHISEKSFNTRIRKILSFIEDNCKKLVIGNITNVNNVGNKKPNLSWTKRVNERNKIYNQIALENNIKINDLHELALSFDKSLRKDDGVHYEDQGYEIFAKKVSEFIKENI